MDEKLIHKIDMWLGVCNLTVSIPHIRKYFYYETIKGTDFRPTEKEIKELYKSIKQYRGDKNIIYKVCLTPYVVNIDWAEESIQNAVNKFRELRKKYLPPEIVKVLFIAESPPQPRLDELDNYRFFYNPDSTTYDSFFYFTIKAIYCEVSKSKKEHLKDFQNDGYYLLDGSDLPLNKFYDERERRSILQDNLDNNLEIIQSLNFDTESPIFLITRNIESFYKTPLTNLGYKKVYYLPFPMGRNIEIYKTTLKHTLIKYGSITCKKDLLK